MIDKNNDITHANDSEKAKSKAKLVKKVKPILSSLKPSFKAASTYRETRFHQYKILKK